MSRFKTRLRRADSDHEGQVDVSVSDTEDAHEPETVLRVDNVGVLLNRREAAALAAVIASTRGLA